MNSSTENLEQTIQRWVDRAIQAARERYGISLDFSESSLPQLYKLLDEAHQSYETANKSGEIPEQTISVWGAYLGETLRRRHQGSWGENPSAKDHRRYFVTTPSGIIYPFELTYLRVVAGINPDEIFHPSGEKQRKRPLGCSIAIYFLIFALVVNLVVVPVTLLVNKHKNEEAARQRTAYEEPFLPFMQVYTADYEKEINDHPEIRGKVLVVDTGSHKIADLNYQIPGEMRAGSPKELNIVVQHYCYTSEYGFYSGTGNIASRVSCRLSLVDMAKRKIVVWQEFIGADFADTVKVDKYGLFETNPGGSPENNEMTAWLINTIKQ